MGRWMKNDRGWDVRCIYTWRGCGRKGAEPMGGRVTNRTGRGEWSYNRLWKGEAYISASAGGITVVYSVAVCFSWVYVAVVSRTCWGWILHLCWCLDASQFRWFLWWDDPCSRTSHPQSFFIHLPMKMEPIESSETSVFRTQTPGSYPKENILQKEHGESLKSRKCIDLSVNEIKCRLE